MRVIQKINGEKVQEKTVVKWLRTKLTFASLNSTVASKYSIALFSDNSLSTKNHDREQRWIYDYITLLCVVGFGTATPSGRSLLPECASQHKKQLDWPLAIIAFTKNCKTRSLGSKLNCLLTSLLSLHIKRTMWKISKSPEILGMVGTCVCKYYQA